MNLCFNGDSHNLGCGAMVRATKKILDRVDLPMPDGWGEERMISVNVFHP